jgi:tellurite resistance protein TerC
MVRVVFNPVVFRLRRWPQPAALAVATVVVFLATWALHAYQSFWLRGTWGLGLPDALFWGILGALISRGIFIAMGTALLSRFEWLILVFGAFLVYTGIKILLEKETEVHPERNPVLKLFQRFVPLTSHYRGKSFFVHDGGRLKATPLMLVLVVVEATDVVFAVDSIPAVFGVTRNAFIVFTSNIFAILGLRALYFLLAGLMHKFQYLSYGLGLVLIFVGAKMLLHDWFEIPIEISLAIVLGLLTAAIVISLLRPGPPESGG